MDDCSWERDTNLAGAQELVVDYERRLLAEGSENPSVMLLCVGERVEL